MSDEVLKTDIVHPDPKVMKNILETQAAASSNPSAAPTKDPVDSSSSSSSSSNLALNSENLVGEIIDGKYKINAKISSGGMGVVYRGEHSLMNREVAIKVLHAHLIENEESLKRFQHEARTASKITHPNAVMTYDFGVFRGLPYLVMELIHGTTLKDVLKTQGALPVDRVYRIMTQVIGALSEAHELGIIHRDLKPENIMLSTDEKGEEWVEVLDFGIAKNLKQADKPATDLTQAGTFYGTPKYASPEQVLGKELDIRADIYALGIILYESLSGEVPFDASTMMATLLKHINEVPRPIRKLKPTLNLPKEIDEVILKALAKDREHRYPTAKELLDAFENAAGLSPTRSMNTTKASSPFVVGFFMAAVFAGLLIGAAQFRGKGRATNRTKEVASTSTESTEAEKPQTQQQTAKDDTSANTAVTSTSATITPKSRNSARALFALAQSAGTLVEEAPQMIGMAQMMAMGGPGGMGGGMMGGGFGDTPGEMNNFPSDFSQNDNPGTESNTQDASNENAADQNSESANQGFDQSSDNPSDNSTENQVAENTTDSETTSQTERDSTIAELQEENSDSNVQNANVQRQQAEQVAALNMGSTKEDPAELFQEGESLYRKKQYNAALEKLEKSVALRPNHMRSRLSLGVVFQRLGRYNEALAQFKSALRMDDGYAPVHFNMACLYSVMGEPEKALDALETMISLSPRTRDWAKNEPDLANIRNNPRFRQIIR